MAKKSQFATGKGTKAKAVSNSFKPSEKRNTPMSRRPPRQPGR